LIEYLLTPIHFMSEILVDIMTGKMGVGRLNINNARLMNVQ